MNKIHGLLFLPFLLIACGRMPEQLSVEEEAPTSPPAELKFDDTVLAQIEKLTVGSSKQDLELALGEPDGKMVLGDTEILYYHGVEMKVKNNQVVSIPGNLAEALKAGFQERNKEKKALADKALVEKAFAEKEIAAQTLAAKPSAASPTRQYNQNIRNRGKEVDINALVGNGTVTIIDFYADWCGPCKSAEPQLKKLAEDPRVTLIQIDIVDWSTPVVAQYGLRSIPNMRVFDATGKQIGKPTHSVSEIQKYVKKAL